MDKTCRNYIIILFAFALIAKLIFAAIAVHPGRGDSSYYLILAENLASGRGFMIDFIGHYLTVPENITHYANDYWMPFTSVIIASFISMLGNSLFVALLPSIIFSMIIGYLTYRLAMYYTGSYFTSAVSAGLVLWAPPLFEYTLIPDSIIYYVLFAVSSLYFLMRSIENAEHPHTGWLSLAALFCGLAQLTRQDGLLLFITIITSLLVFIKRSSVIKYILILAGVYLLVLSPLIILNLKYLGVPMPGNALKTALFTEYFDIYDYSGGIPFSNYLEMGFIEIVKDKVRVGLFNAKVAFEYLGSFIWVLAVLGIGRWFLNSRRRVIYAGFLPPVIFILMLYLVYTLVTTHISALGGFLRSGMVMIPFVIIIAVHTFQELIKSSKLKWLAVIALTLILAGQSVYNSKELHREHQEIARFHHELKATLEKISNEDTGLVLMTRTPWEIHYSTKYKAVQVPRGNADLIYKVATKYDADYLLASHSLKEFSEIYRGEISDDRFILLKVFESSNNKLYIINRISK